MTVKKGDKIKVEYEGKLENGEVFDSSNREGKQQPLEFEVGANQVIKGFDEGVVGMEKGEEKEITIKPEEAYGPRREEAVQKVPKDQLKAEQEIKPGMVLGLKAPDGREMAVPVKDVDSESITIDMNHPLAGKTLIFTVKVVEIEEK